MKTLTANWKRRNILNLNCEAKIGLIQKKKKNNYNFSAGSVVKNPITNAGNSGLIPGPEIFHMSWSN